MSKWKLYKTEVKSKDGWICYSHEEVNCKRAARHFASLNRAGTARREGISKVTVTLVRKKMKVRGNRRRARAHKKRWEGIIDRLEAKSPGIIANTINILYDGASHE